MRSLREVWLTLRPIVIVPFGVYPSRIFLNIALFYLVSAMIGRPAAAAQIQPAQVRIGAHVPAVRIGKDAVLVGVRRRTVQDERLEVGIPVLGELHVDR